MTTIATAHGTTTALPAAFFDKWADMATWPEWNTDTEWVHLDGEFRQSATGKLKPKGGPTVPFLVESLVQDREFVDVSKLIGARLTFAHFLTRADGITTLDVEISITGPLSWLWIRLMGKSLAASAQPDVDNLIAAIAAVQV
ncbi:hypothetical protein ACLMAL_18070 [Nocardia sp. CWNU-33]|uniref:hypothetical protein n=1 Tax=Nocardia sp. CWNU-33 TaxID=3392117 RepID=UPI00398F17D5